MLKHRLQSGFLLGGALLAAVFFLPDAAVIWVLLLACGLGLVEFYTFLDASGVPHFKAVGIAGGLSLVAVTWAGTHFGWANSDEVSGMALFGAVAAVLLRQLTYTGPGRPWETAAGTLLGILYVAFLFNFFVKMLGTWGGREGRLLVLYLVVVVKFTDIGAYFTGCAIGRHKLIPRISPAKSWEGCIGGILAAIAASLVYLHLVRGQWTALAFTPTHAVAIAVLLGITGIVGDLVESLFKRAAGVKDSGTLIQGMGGILDVLDSLLLAAPVLYVYARLFLNGAH